jgi:hypothetical protein
MFDEKYVSSLPNDLVEAAQKVCKDFRGIADLRRAHPFEDDASYIEDYANAYGLMSGLAEAMQAHDELPNVEFSGTENNTISQIEGFSEGFCQLVNKWATENLLRNAALLSEKTKFQFASRFNNFFVMNLLMET